MIAYLGRFVEDESSLSDLGRTSDEPRALHRV